MTSKEMAQIACKALDEKKGVDIISINVTDHTSVCDYFVICNGTNSSHVKALCDTIEEKFKENGILIKSREGYTEGRWIALDLGDLVVHIFNDETRLFYHLERLWTFGDNIERYPS